MSKDKSKDKEKNKAKDAASAPDASASSTSLTRKTLIDLLNEDLSREYQAIISYVIYSQVLKGAQYMNIADELAVHATEELAHAIAVANHIDYLVRVAGIDHVGLGSDFSGIDATPVGLESVDRFPVLIAELLRRGYSDTDAAKIAGGNLLRAMREMEGVSERLRRTTPAPPDHYLP